MASQPKPDLLRIYTDDEHGGVMRVDYQGKALGVLATLPYFGSRSYYTERPSMFDRRLIELEIIEMEPGFFDPIPKPPYNTVDLHELGAHFDGVQRYPRRPA